MKVRSWLKLHTFQSALHMQSVDHLNIDSAPFPVKCVTKLQSTFGVEVIYLRLCAYVCLHNVRRVDCAQVLYVPRANL